MKKILLLASILAISITSYGQLYEGEGGAMTLTGVAPQETIVANSASLKGKIDASSKKFNFRQSLTSFSFSQGAMQKKDAEEKYWETENFPTASFAGMIINDVDLAKDGTYKVTAKGKFTMHGVTKSMTIPATITVKGGTITVKANFSVFLSDYDIEIPRLMSMKVSEEFKVETNLVLKKK